MTNDDIKVCRDCGQEFSLREKRTLYKGGYINQCAKCSASGRDANKKYLGRPGATNKGANISIFRSNLDFVRQVLKLESRRGPTANLDLSSAVNASAKEDELK
jgi:hypothetical protein